MNITVGRLLEAKGRQVFSAAPDTTALQALEMMAKKGIGTVLVIADDKLMGIVSERDFIRKVIVEKRRVEDCPLADIMTAKVITVTPDQTVEACMKLMTEKRIRHLPVLEDGKVAGIVSIGDVVKFTLAEKETIIKHYERYIYEGW